MSRWIVESCVIAAVIGYSVGACAAPSIVPGGDATAGQTDFTQLCARCHTSASIASGAGFITNNMGSVSPAMSGITLTDQQVADLQAYLTSL